MCSNNSNFSQNYWIFTTTSHYRVHLAIVQPNTNFATVQSSDSRRLLGWVYMGTNFYVSSLVLHTECRIPAFYLFVWHCCSATQSVFERKLVCFLSHLVAKPMYAQISSASVSHVSWRSSKGKVGPTFPENGWSCMLREVNQYFWQILFIRPPLWRVRWHLCMRYIPQGL